MSKLAEAILYFLQQETNKGKKSFIALDLELAGKISNSLALKIIQELEENGYIEVHREWVSGSFNLI